MPRTKRLPGALRGHGTALAIAGAAAAAVASVAGTASAADIQTPTTHTADIQTTAAHSANLAASSGTATLAGPSAGVTLTNTTPAHLAPASTAKLPAAPHAIPARRPVQVAVTPSHPAAAHPAVSPAPAAAAHHVLKRDVPAKPWELYDSTTPSQIPAHHEVATYADGAFAASPHEVSGGGHVVWIDTNGSDPRASALDVEPGDATPQAAASWARAKLSADPNSPAIIYTMRSEWPATQAAVSSLPAHMRSEIRWWIADPTGVAHMVPGANATQWYWGSRYDISTVDPGF
jgi:hypothetical protein